MCYNIIENCSYYYKPLKHTAYFFRAVVPKRHKGVIKLIISIENLEKFNNMSFAGKTCLLKLLKVYGEMTIWLDSQQIVANKIGISRSTLSKGLSELVKQNILIMSGNGHYKQYRLNTNFIRI